MRYFTSTNLAVTRSHARQTGERGGLRGRATGEGNEAKRTTTILEHYVDGPPSSAPINYGYSLSAPCSRACTLNRFMHAIMPPDYRSVGRRKMRSSLKQIKFPPNGILINRQATKCPHPNLLNQVQQAVVGGASVKLAFLPRNNATYRFAQWRQQMLFIKFPRNIVG